jgi:hypothetical protein
MKPGFGLLSLLLPILLSLGCTLSFDWASSSPEAPTAEAPPAEAMPTPSPEFSPDKVVRIQLEALQQNDETNQGVKTTFNFASPANRENTGPLPRFIKMLQSPPYNAMLNYKSVEFDPVKVSDDLALQRVRLIAKDGQPIIFIFSLSKQSQAPYQDCWMTDGVVVEPTKEIPKGSA